MENEFEDIRPYNDSEIVIVLRRIIKNRWLISGIRKEVFPRCPAPLKPVFEFIIKTYFLSKVPVPISLSYSFSP
jgi:hypothetical protein